MEISHENNDAFVSLLMHGGDRLKLLDLVLVTHRHDSGLWPEKRLDELHHRSESGDNIGFFNQFAATLSHIAKIARTRANTENHDVIASGEQGPAAGSSQR